MNLNDYFRPTATQAKYMDAIEWLLEDSISSRGTGRSYAVAWAHIFTAIKNPNRFIPLNDFNSVNHIFQVRKIFFESVRRIIDSLPDELKSKFDFKLTDLAIKYKE